jgi:hypothetical protein
VDLDPRSRLGDAPRDASRLGSSRVLIGNGLVLKTGPADRAAREAFVLELDGLPVRVPDLVDAGDGWVLIEEVEVVAASSPDDALGDLARLHDAFAGSDVLDDPRLRGVTRGELALLRERSVMLTGELDLPPELRALAADPEPLLAEIGDAVTLVHGDAWPGNVLSTPGGRRCWIDWEEAGVGHPALDLATWLHGSPWVPRASDPERDLAVYLAARAGDLDALEFGRAVDAAVVLLFLLLDLPGLTASDREIVERRAATAERLAL